MINDGNITVERKMDGIFHGCKGTSRWQTTFEFESNITSKFIMHSNFSLQTPS